MTNYLLSNGSVLIIHEKPIIIKGRHSYEYYILKDIFAYVNTIYKPKGYIKKSMNY